MSSASGDQTSATSQPSHIPQTIIDTTTKPRISFEEPTSNKNKPLHDTAHPMHNASLRKSSYASVREVSNAAQSFRTRRTSTESNLPNDYLPRRPESFVNLGQLAKQAAEHDDEYESALTDDESDTTPVSVGSALYTDSEEEVEEKQEPVTIESLPDEILDMVFDLVQMDTQQEYSIFSRVDLFSCLSVSRRVHAAALRALYKHVIIYRSKTFHKLVNSVQDDPELGQHIKTLDFSHYSHMGYGKSRGQTNGTPYLTKETMKIVLSHSSSLRAFLVHEHLDDELDLGVLSTLLSIKSLKYLDFAGCTSHPFVNSFTGLLSSNSPQNWSQIKRLSLHECTTLKPAVFETILPQLNFATHLDLAHTQVNDAALLSIPTTASITHLNLGRCTQITGAGVVRFLSQHPAARHSLVWLDLSADASRYRLLNEEDLNALLPVLPHTLRALNLGGAKITRQHVPVLRLLATHLEELGLKGANLGLSTDINQILSLPPDRQTKFDQPELRSTLRYIDLTDISSVSQMSLSYSPVSIKDNSSLPLEVIELGSAVLTEISRRNKNVKDPDWTVKELGRRGWCVRTTNGLPPSYTLDDGYRNWKMGARWWGMRKLPVVDQDVGGMYGYFMFKRN